MFSASQSPLTRHSFYVYMLMLFSEKAQHGPGSGNTTHLFFYDLDNSSACPLAQPVMKALNKIKKKAWVGSLCENFIKDSLLQLLPSVLCTKCVQKGRCADVEVCHLPFDCYPATEGVGPSEPSVCQQTVLSELWVEQAVAQCNRSRGITGGPRWVRSHVCIQTFP